jgi:hypothetical protein
MKQTQFIPLFFLFLSVSGLFFSCGIEDYAYLEPVPSGNIQLTLNNRARIDLPPSQGSSFTQYNIYYRIYISDILEAGEIQKSRPAMGNINPALANDYFALEPYTNTNNNNVNASTDILFRNRSYQTLSYEPGLVINSPGVLELYFPDQTGSIPYLIYGGKTYNLYRSNGNSAFNPQPDRYFRNSSEINSSANAISTINADVVDKSGAGGPRYTYAALYIAAEGLNQPSYTPFYSIPTFIGVFMLPARN